MLPLLTKHLPLSDYGVVWQQMRDFCDSRTVDTADELWLLQHSSIYTLGQAGRAAHLLRNNGIPLIKSDRGGQITYHGPGQIIAYLMLDLRRKPWGVRQLTQKMQTAVINLLQDYGVVGETRAGAPGVYVDGAKIAALGLRVRRGCTYHGLSFNAEMDLSPFADINPCGYAGLPITQLSALTTISSVAAVSANLARHLQRTVGEVV